MHPTSYCQQKIALKDPGFSFSLKMLTRPEREAVTAIMAFFVEIDDVIFECQEPAVAFAKLNWWRLEAAKLMEGQAVDHPVMLALQQAQKVTPFSAERLIDMIDGIAQNLNFSPFRTFEDVMLHIIHTAGVRERLMGEIVARDMGVASDVLYQLALVLELARYIQHLRRYVRRGLIVFGEDEMIQFQVSQTLLEACHTTPSIKSLLQYQVDKAELAFRKAEAALTTVQRKALVSVMVRCQMALALLREIKMSEFCVLEKLISLTPLRCWWVAYRCNVEG